MGLKQIVIKGVVYACSFVLVQIFGSLGTFMTILAFLKLGYAKFFRRVSRPQIPIQAQDPVYGQHNMITLKVLDRFLGNLNRH